MTQRKVILLGLDGLNPELVYKWQDELPNIKKIMEQGICYGKVKSCVSPTAASTWSSVLSGKNPGQFGFWDFTYRKDYSYGEPELATSRVRDERTGTLYKILSEFGKKVAVVNVPVSYPPPEIPNGYSISCSMTPDLESEFTYPPSLKEEIKKIIGDYLIDASPSGTDFRQMNKEETIKRIYDMDKQRFVLTKHFITNKDCDFVFTVIRGTDRMAHLFYRYFDENHVRYTASENYKDGLKNHYRFCDENIGEIMDLIDSNSILGVLSSYSVQRMDGRINLNEWLIHNGYLSVSARPSSLTSLSKAKIDWLKTIAWTTGYTGRVYLNVKGRESEGRVHPKDYHKVLDELSREILAITDPNGRKLDTRTYKRDHIHFGRYAKYGPDLFVHFDNCYWSTNEMIGYDSIYGYDTTKGPDDGTDAPCGFFALMGPGVGWSSEISGPSLVDIAPTVLTSMSLDIPADMEGRSLVSEEERVCSPEDEEEIKKRLTGLGYFEE